MTEIEPKVTINKKSRKNKAPIPIYRTSRESPTSEEIKRTSPLVQIQKPEVSIALKPTEALMSTKSSPITPPKGPGGGPISSYSDYMRSLAAKYNNNE